MNVQLAITHADNLRSKIDNNEMRQLMGLSAPKVRHLLNNLASQSPNYLEIGCYLGGTLRAALYGNPIYAVAIDDFSMMPNKRQMFFDNTAHMKFDFYEGDCFKFDLSNIKEPIELYFYDADHSFEATQKALEYYYPVLADEFVMVVDDWNMKKIPNAIFTKAKELKLDVIENYDLISPQQGEWWNSLGVIWFRKNK